MEQNLFHLHQFNTVDVNKKHHYECKYNLTINKSLYTCVKILKND